MFSTLKLRFRTNINLFVRKEFLNISLLTFIHIVVHIHMQYFRFLNITICSHFKNCLFSFLHSSKVRERRVPIKYLSLFMCGVKQPCLLLYACDKSIYSVCTRIISQKRLPHERKSALLVFLWRFSSVREDYVFHAYFIYGVFILWLDSVDFLSVMRTLQAPMIQYLE